MSIKKKDMRELLEDALQFYEVAGFRSYTRYEWRTIEAYLNDLFDLDDKENEAKPKVVMNINKVTQNGDNNAVIGYVENLTM